MPDQRAAVRAAMNQSLTALGRALTTIGQKLDRTPSGANYDALEQREDAILNQRREIRQAALDKILNSLDVVAAVAEVQGAAKSLKDAAAELKSATDFLKKADEVVDDATKFAGLFKA
jgi:hypothetical protein